MLATPDIPRRANLALASLVFLAQLAALVLLPWAWPVCRRLNLRQVGRLVTAGLLGMVAYTLPVTAGLQWLPAGPAARPGRAWATRTRAPGVSGTG